MSLAVLGAGVTGLAAGVAAGAVVYEAADSPGGICSSYYVRPGDRARLTEQPRDGEVYRFELGGGHWIFGGNPIVLRYIGGLTPLRSYTRRSSVYFPARDLHVPYPLQNHLRVLGEAVASRALPEMAQPFRTVRTMEEWLLQSFGPTLCALFFTPFHRLYTAGLFDRISPQDAYKSPVDLGLAIRGALSETPAVGYNAGFAYPEGGLDTLTRRMAAACPVQYGKRVVRLDLGERVIAFADGSTERYDRLLSTLPLDQTIVMAGLQLGVEPDPHTSVLVLNIGARRGPRCPDVHWLYLAETVAGFHRVGFYDNVDTEFLPRSTRARHDRASLYVERAYPGGEKPDPGAIADYGEAVVRELQAWGFIDAVEVLDPTWIDVAYTWSWPGSTWTRVATRALEAHGVYPVGRYGRWVFQGIAESIHEGLAAGTALRGA
jgi:protoporphyrinogen oxidase